MIDIKKEKDNQKARSFCYEFINSNKPKYIFGRNEFAESIANHIEIDGFIDEFTKDSLFLGKPIINIKNIPENALVIIVVVKGRPLIAEKRAQLFKLNYLNYYSFLKYSNLELKNIYSWAGFKSDFKINRIEYENIFEKFQDATSKNQYQNILNFRLHHNLDFMRDFKAIEDRQYFEEFLNLKKSGETFVDIGGFDGYTSIEFINRCPDYNSVYFFEPDETNIAIAKNRLEKFKNIIFNPIGASNKKETLNFDTRGSASKISKDGSSSINVDKLDNIIKKPVTFIKMDIEGAEKPAIEGAKNIIMAYHPTLAICVYHRFDDFWKIPQLVFSIRDDYDIYLRHYSEGVDETVMFFVPKKI
ncbi:hypothetical protein MNBD_GAMMA09-3017 [hydrothermal vent metagenome]|uniref:Methyltransferase FkbM domain-containing protein n=1 Tax=hydrothermal vent metagenome TaxID=652676 RepID=A0A3B0XHJ7_9ZZZZ